ncbi:MAG: WG repeat-containing protein [Abditibacteriota bacterium]|nr:WG repeat-containing protein [Abditibacteriota bacterium]
MKQKLLIILSFILLSLPLFPLDYALLNSEGKPVTDFSYSEIYPFFEDLALCKRNNLYGYIDKQGKEVIPCEYTYGEFFQNGATKVCKGNEFYYINKENTPIFKKEIKAYTPKTGNVIEVFKPYTPSNLLLIEKDNLCGLGDTEGTTIIPCEYNRVISNRGDLFLVSKNNLFGYVDRYNRVAIPLSFQRASEFKDGMACVTKKGKTFVINERGETVAKGCERYLIYSSNLILGIKKGKIGGFNREGKQIIAFEYSQNPSGEVKSLKYDTMTKENGCFILYKNGSWFLFNKEGVGVNNIKATDISEWEKEYTVAFTGVYVVDAFGRMEFKSKKEAKKYVDDLKVKSITDLENKYDIIKQEGTSILLDRNWKEIIPQKYELIKDFKDNVYVAKKKFSDEFYGMVDIGGECVVSFDYEELTNFYDNVAIGKSEGKYGLINRENERITPFDYDYIDNFILGFAKAKKNNKWGIIDNIGKEVIPCLYEDIKIYPTNSDTEIFFAIGK